MGMSLRFNSFRVENLAGKNRKPSDSREFAKQGEKGVACISDGLAGLMAKN
jgi:hypothetical protein